ncbi:sensor histidine kinase [Streptomyces chengbuensis]|uniref:sensor histidine kinase n=1 Tax=Streptomyces chengbuensis TaxID=3053466 RepID=UPI0025B5F4F2|nr:sensor histidine kinase [Streptomyces sp. HUAS CB01]WJY50352.1 sensor histidine kinase [Streptomyces sp. HUAS CB01]
MSRVERTRTRTRTPQGKFGERALEALARDPRDVPHAVRNDAVLAGVLAAAAVASALFVPVGRRPDALGWALLLALHVPLAWRRRRPVFVLVAVAVCAVPYHALDNPHVAAVPASCVALYTVAATGSALRTLLVGTAVVGLSVTVSLTAAPKEAVEVLRVSGWIVAVLFLGVDVRIYRRYIASVVERAERTREEEAARRVAEERLRIARDLHDLLAHSITVIGVRTSVAAHVLAVDPERLDRGAVAAALDEIADTCRTARGELRATLRVLRGAGDRHDGPLPGLDALPALVRAAGARLDMPGPESTVPPATGAAVYRIVQESLTNAVRHAGPDAKVTVTVVADTALDRLRVSVTDDGRPPGPRGSAGGPSGTGAGGSAGPRADAPAGRAGSGYGLSGMRERARSAGGTLSAGPRDGGGFEVAAVLPLTAKETPA